MIKTLKLSCFLLPSHLSSAIGTVEIDKITSIALSKSKLGEKNTRNIAIYLPPSYKTTNKKFPVLYLLHGLGDNYMNFVDDEQKLNTIQGLMDTGIEANRFGEMIIVTPDESTPWGGSFYVNSTSTGNWEDFTAKELVNYIDKNYRTIANAESRAIAGHSMGGYGAITLAMKHPDVFSVAYSMNGGFLSFTAELAPENPDVKKFVSARNTQELLATKSPNAIGMLAVSQAFSPNPSNREFLTDKPYRMAKGKIVINPTAYNRWIDHDVIRMAKKYKKNLSKLRGLKFDCGNEEDIKLIEINNQILSRELTNLKIKHQFEQYNGDHRNRLWQLDGRIYNDVLPFIFDNLVQ